MQCKECGKEIGEGRGYCMRHGGPARHQREERKAEARMRAEGKRLERAVLSLVERLAFLDGLAGRLDPDSREGVEESARFLREELAALKTFASRTGLKFGRTVKAANQALARARDALRPPDFRKPNMGMAGGRKSGKTARKRVKEKITRRVPLTVQDVYHLSGSELARARELGLLPK